MKMPFIKLSAITLAILIGGCGSTSKGLPTENGELIYPSMPIIKENKFEWDDSKSEALNVVYMAKPAGIGNSLRDYDDGRQASIGLTGGLSGLFDVGLGLASSGLFTVVQGESLRDGANSAVEFKPTIVDVVSKELIYENGKPTYKKVRNHIAKKVMDAINANQDDVEWGGVYSLYDGTKRFDMQLIINNESVCKNVRRVSSGDENEEPFMTRNFSRIFVDGEDKIRQYCSFGFYINIPYETANDEVVIVAEMQSGPYFVEGIVKNYDGYVVVPDIYYFNSQRAMKTDYAYVSKNGDKLLFQK